MDIPAGGIPKISEFSSQDVEQTLKGVEISATDAKIVRHVLLSGLGRVVKEDIEAAKGAAKGTIRIKVKKPNFFQKLVALFVRKVLRKDYELSTRVTVIGPKGKKHTTPIPEQHLRKMQIRAYQRTYHDESQPMSLALRDFKDFTRRVGKNLRALGGENSIRGVEEAKAFLEKTIEKDYADTAKPGYLKELSKIYQKGMEKLIGKMPITVLKDVSISKGYDELAAVLEENAIYGTAEKAILPTDASKLLEGHQKTHGDEVMRALGTFSKEVAQLMSIVPINNNIKMEFVEKYVKPGRQDAFYKALDAIDASHQKYKERIGEVLTRYAAHESAQRPSEAEEIVEHLEFQRQKYLEDPPWGPIRKGFEDWLNTVEGQKEPEKMMEELHKKMHPVQVKARLNILNHKLDVESAKLIPARSKEPVVSVDEFRGFTKLLMKKPDSFDGPEKVLVDLEDSICGARPVGRGIKDAAYDNVSAVNYQTAIREVATQTRRALEEWRRNFKK